MYPKLFEPIDVNPNMIIIVTIQPNVSEARFRFNTKDFDISDAEWKSMSEDRRRAILQETADHTDLIYPQVHRYEEAKP